MYTSGLPLDAAVYFLIVARASLPVTLHASLVDGVVVHNPARENQMAE
jgi:hypothetical protein